MTHYVLRCRHGRDMSQCRCPAPDKPVRIVECNHEDPKPKIKFRIPVFLGLNTGDPRSPRDIIGYAEGDDLYGLWNLQFQETFNDKLADIGLAEPLAMSISIEGRQR